MEMPKKKKTRLGEQDTVDIRQAVTSKNSTVLNDSRDRLGEEASPDVKQAAQRKSNEIDNSNRDAVANSASKAVSSVSPARARQESASDVAGKKLIQDMTNRQMQSLIERQRKRAKK